MSRPIFAEGSRLPGSRALQATPLQAGLPDSTWASKDRGRGASSSTIWLRLRRAMSDAG